MEIILVPPDSRTPLFKVRKPPFSTINENNTINDNKERHETSSEEHDTDGEDKEVNEPRSATPRSVHHWEYCCFFRHDLDFYLARVTIINLNRTLW